MIDKLLKNETKHTDTKSYEIASKQQQVAVSIPTTGKNNKDTYKNLIREPNHG